ncbi:MmcQ/YjbR family DNA-binding protein [Ruminococcus sp.]|uniref:MmcQ/YjbR family DNA-binding protein n=1 Tax=Ruminococcus sp. TaxID=41978 RepID=UPI003867E65F
MNREQLIEYIETTYGVKGDNPWQKDPDSTVFRHIGNKKWFALVMTIKKSSLGLNNPELIDIVNLKCDKSMLGSALENNGFYPAYHMNKENWVTIALDGSANDKNIKFFLDISFELTAPKIK